MFRIRPLDRQILALAVPALGALVAEPLFLAADTAMVGQLGADHLAAMGIASTVLHTVVGLLIFLAYATTPTVARRLGRGDRPGAVRAGIDGLWLALSIGAVLAVLGVWLSGSVVRLFGAVPVVSELATDYLGISMLGIPGMLLVIAATGLFRGLQDTRTPLVVTVAGFSANITLNALLIYGLGLGIVGSAIGSVIAQWGMAAVLIAIAARAARREGVGLRPGLAGVRASALAGGWLLLRSVSMRIALVATIVVATSLGTTQLAATHVLLTLFSLVAFALDAVAIAAQAMVGHALGREDVPRVRQVLARVVRLALVASVSVGAVLVITSPVIGAAFSQDSEVRAAVGWAVLVLAVATPLAAYVFALDGVLIGAGDARYLALASTVTVAVFLGALFAVPLLQLGAVGGTVAIQLAFLVVYLAARAVTLALRIRSDAWMRIPAR